MVNDRWCVTLLPITVFDGPSWFWHMPGAHHQHLRISIQRSAVHLSVYSLCTKTPGYTSQGRSHKLHYISTILCCLTWYRVHMDAPLAMLGVRHHGSVFGNSFAKLPTSHPQLQGREAATLSAKWVKRASKYHVNRDMAGIWHNVSAENWQNTAKHKYPSN